jgi:NitT/TauT family transport system ATP-binding protein
MTDAAAVSLRSVGRTFASGEVVALTEIDLEIAPREFVSLIGPSGCGKSTLLKAVGGYMKPVEGEIRLKGEAVTRPGPDRMMVFQEFDQLLPWRTVKENVMFPLRASGRLPRKAAEEKALEYIAKVNLSGFADSFPHTLSGGMKQRVAIARGMAMEPDILLMDEPFAALDALTRRKMQDELLALWEGTRFTVLFVTHSIPEAIKVGSRILLLSPHPGQVKAEMDSLPAGSHGADVSALEQRIHAMLFADAVEETRDDQARVHA